MTAESHIQYANIVAESKENVLYFAKVQGSALEIFFSGSNVIFSGSVR